ncbi:TrkH family potassium uptake protein [Brachybacterium sp. ACRRE]|uniref:TrkH family potassium uptake protein n=1 Tax=Brachybacterium sp. ACRRE TaxID=2918184 RepID=UPI001EF2E22E|nr:potassium transporter TrkG [Brachybacterium sp. ACRRE]MCG7309655.1 TrkH family potassium uptake protein [Brachybacterium sp. ACRRE]
MSEGRDEDGRTDLSAVSLWQRIREFSSTALATAARTSPARLALTVFTAMIGLVTLLLMSPLAASDGQATDFRDAVFTAVSAICVTGLTTVDTATHWSTFGLVVLMVAMKIGGLGVLTLASLLGLSVMRSMGLAQRIITARETRAEQLAEVGSVLRTIVITSTAFEVLTFLALVPYMIATEHGTGTSVFYGAFYAISAFNNAGFVPDPGGISQYLGDPFFSIPISTAVFMGSLGFPVVLVLVKRWRTPHHWTLHAKLTLATSGILLVAGMLGYLAMEWSNPHTLGREDFGAKVLASLFASVMPRSGGFSTLDIASLEPETRLFTDLLMFIGGGSGSTGGGIKVTTFALLALSIVAEARGDRDVEVFGRRIPQETIRQAIGVLVMSASVVFIATFLTLQLTPFSLDQVLFEVLSAFGTVGLSTGITPHLGDAASYVLIVCMYLGRIGPMTLGAALALRSRSRVVRLPSERPIVG